jgi:hypothetical protein
MGRRADQGAGRRWAIGFFAAVVCLVAPAAGAADAPPPSRQALAAECDALIAAAVKTPYGWGWQGDAAPPAAGPQGRAGRPTRAATIDARRTAAAGLVLHVAGQSLGEERFAKAAVQAARALAAVQLNTGQVPAAGVVGANAGGRDAPLAVPSRAATCAALGLFLAVAQDAGDEGAAATATRRAGLKAANWLVSQQTRHGGWLVTHPADAPPGEGTKLVRLDGVEYRDATVALCLAARVLGDERLLRGARAALQDLDALRMGDEKTRGLHLWTTAYTADGAILDSVPEFAPAVDTLAARNAMQALLAARVLLDEEAATPMLNEAAVALAKLPKHHDEWRRRYELVAPPPAQQVGDEPAGPKEDEPPVSPLFPPDDGRSLEAGESFAVSGVDEIVRAAGKLESLGAEKYRLALGGRLPVEHRAALLLCGLYDDALSVETPRQDAKTAGGDVPGRLRRGAAMAWALWRPVPREGVENQ